MTLLITLISTAMKDWGEVSFIETRSNTLVTTPLCGEDWIAGITYR